MLPFSDCSVHIDIHKGHETTLDALCFSLAMLALNPDIQRRLQKELDETLKERRSDQWTFDKDFPALMNGLIGAILHETTRSFPAIPGTPRKTLSSQSLLINGEPRQLPAKTLVIPTFSGMHRNPKYWSAPENALGLAQPYLVTDACVQTSTVDAWDPMRWLEKSKNDDVEKSEEAYSSLKPAVSGPRMPFSRGPRSCMGAYFSGFVNTCQR